MEQWQQDTLGESKLPIGVSESSICGPPLADSKPVGDERVRIFIVDFVEARLACRALDTLLELQCYSADSSLVSTVDIWLLFALVVTSCFLLHERKRHLTCVAFKAAVSFYALVSRCFHLMCVSLFARLFSTVVLQNLDFQMRLFSGTVGKNTSSSWANVDVL